MSAGGLSYFSTCLLVCGFHRGACPEAVASDAIKTSKIEIGVTDIVENFIRCEVVEALKW
jgi:hypothetical protein